MTDEIVTCEAFGWEKAAEVKMVPGTLDDPTYTRPEMVDGQHVQVTYDARVIDGRLVLLNPRRRPGP